MTHNKFEVHMLMGKFFNHYLPDIENRSKQTINTYRNSISSYIKFLEQEKGIAFDKLDIKHFEVKLAEDWIAYLKKTGKSVLLPDNAATRGMVKQVEYLVKVEEA